MSHPSSPPSQGSSSPSPASWRRSDLVDLLCVLADAQDLLGRVVATEQGRVTHSAAKAALHEVMLAGGHVGEVLEVVGRTTQVRVLPRQP